MSLDELLDELLFLTPVVCCFDGDDPPKQDPANGPNDDGPDNDDDEGGEDGGKKKVVTLTQEELNAMMAENKKNTRKELEQKTAALKKAEQMYESLLAKHNLSDQERATLEQNLEAVKGELRTKEENAKIEKRRLEESLTKQIKTLEQRYQDLESKYKSETIRRSWHDAFADDAHNKKLAVDLMFPSSKLVEEVDETSKPTGRHKVVVELQDVDSDGNPTISTYTPEEAVKRMKELPDLYGGLFKSNLVSGVGGSNYHGAGDGSDGVDLKKLARDNPAKFRELMKQRPELFGLRR